MPDALSQSSLSAVDANNGEYEDWEIGIDRESDEDLDNWIEGILALAPGHGVQPGTSIVVGNSGALAVED